MLHVVIDLTLSTVNSKSPV